jgi:CubicO group peptidase (beta-lactamase class C family)
MSLSTTIASILQQYIEQGIEEGLQLCVYHHGQRIVDLSAGVRNTAGDALTPDTLIFGWSMTKGITALAIHQLAERGLLAYDDPVCRYWPEFAQNGKRFISIRQLLTHTSGMQHMPHVSTEEICDWNAMCARFAAMAPQSYPGEVSAYHAISYGWLLGELIRRVDGRSIGTYVHDEICAPLGITDLYIGLPVARQHASADLSYDAKNAVLNADHVGNQQIADAPHLFANRHDVRAAAIPGANVMASARALATVYASLVGEGVNGIRLLSARRVDMLRSVQRSAIDGTVAFKMLFGLGYQLPDYENPSPMSHRTGVFGHGGWGGSMSFADPDQQFAFSLTKTRMVTDIEPLPIGMVVADAIRTELGIPSR